MIYVLICLFGLCTGRLASCLIGQALENPSCRKALARSPWVELLCAVLAVFLYTYYSLNPFSVFVFLLGTLFIVICAVDLSSLTIPHAFILALIPFALVSLSLLSQISLMEKVFGFFCVSAPMLLLALVIPGGFGGGDIKLMAVCGFLLGWQLTLTAMLIALMLGGLAAFILLAAGRVSKTSHLPFGPPLCLGCFVSLLWGEGLLALYLG